MNVAGGRGGHKRLLTRMPSSSRYEALLRNAGPSSSAGRSRTFWEPYRGPAAWWSAQRSWACLRSQAELENEGTVALMNAARPQPEISVTIHLTTGRPALYIQFALPSRGPMRSVRLLRPLRTAGVALVPAVVVLCSAGRAAAECGDYVRI